MLTGTTICLLLRYNSINIHSHVVYLDAMFRTDSKSVGPTGCHFGCSHFCPNTYVRLSVRCAVTSVLGHFGPRHRRRKVSKSVWDPFPPSLPFPSLPSLPFPSPSLRSRHPSLRLGDLGERSSSPSGSGRSRGARPPNGFW